MKHQSDLHISIPVTAAVRLMGAFDSLMHHAEPSADRDALVAEMDPIRQQIIQAFVIQEQRA